EAREKLRATPVWTIIVDGDSESEELRRWLADLKHDPERAQGVAVIAIGNRLPGDADRAIDAWLEKPVDRGSLLRELARLAGPRILIVDDDPAIRYAVRKLFNAASLHVLEAPDARSGWDAAHAWGPQLIVLDLELPDMRGEQLLRELKADPATAPI